MVRRGRSVFILTLCAIAPDYARAEPPPAAAEKTPPLHMEQEVVVQGWRYTPPSFQEEVEFHNQEYRRLKQKYDKPPPPKCLANVPLTNEGKDGPALTLGCTMGDQVQGLTIRF